MHTRDGGDGGLGGQLGRAAAAPCTSCPTAAPSPTKHFLFLPFSPVGDLPVKPNKHIEDWAVRREHIENEFRWDGKTLANIGLWALAFPYFVYSVW